MVTAAGAIFGLSIMEAGALLIGAAYLISLSRNWRPMTALRQENKDLRADLNRANVKIDQLEDKVKDLEKASIPVLHAELVEVARILDRVGKQLDKLDHSVKANTAAVQLVASQSVIADALTDHTAKQ